MARKNENNALYCQKCGQRLSEAAAPRTERKRRLWPWALGLVVILVIGGGLLLLALMQPGPATPTTQLPTPTPIATATGIPGVKVGAIVTATRPVNIAFILDASSSMNATIGGHRRLAIAQEVMAQLVDKLPENVSMGVWVYGHRVGDSDAEKAQSC